MKLLHHPASPNCRKVEFVIRHLNLSVDREQVELFGPSGKSEALIAANPNQMVPTLIDGEMTLWESNAIMPYLCGKVDNTGLWPKSNVRYDIMRWMYWQTAHFGPTADTFTFQNMLKGMIGQGGPDASALEAGEKKLQRFGAVLNGALEGKKYLVGDTLTLADIAVAASLTYAEPAKIPLDDFPHIIAWRKRLDEVPAWNSSKPQM